ncbi:hypothetical protein B1C78_10410 [Thioalkalivibrio denitrificans]|uniref:histidine kinase n=1 Tax=Thioalkalivibrio denitrificans TaxID=108003 RepID=A0A1V3NF52_9GAMM|nr:ATP-binding protein [Thioalkalivibrio denitrificans]OOG23690.1 hypothetical protein B1C78_10410 [Thioalkalivibrio denitrificans]
MKLRTLSGTFLTAALAALLLLGAFSVHAWRTFSGHLEDIHTFSELRTEMEQFKSAIDYVTLIRSDIDVLQGVGVDARRLAESIRTLDPVAGAPAILHLNEIAHLSEVLAEAAPDTSLLHADELQRDTLMALSRQLLVHRSGVTDVLNTLDRAQDESVATALMALVGTLTAVAMALALLSLIGFTLIHRRLRRPLADLQRGLSLFARGDPDTHIPIRGNDELGELARLFNRMVDQRQQYEDTLKDQEERFRQLAENIDEVFWMSTPDKRSVLYVSPAFERVWGVSCGALYDRPEVWLDAIHEEDRARVIEAAGRQAKGTYNEEYRVVRPDGSVRMILDRAFPIHDDRGQVYRIAGVAVDVTHMRQMEVDLRERVKELRTLYRILELTADATRTTYEVCEEVANMLPAGFTWPEHAVARVVIGSEEWRSPCWETPTFKIMSTIRHDGTDEGFIEVGYTRLPAEAQPQSDPFLPEEQPLLDGVAGHLSRMLHTRRMIHTLNQSDRLSAIGQLTGGVAHDFNNLLTVIIGNAELLQLRMDRDDTLRGLVDMIGSAAQRGAELTQRLLAFSRHQVLEPRIIDANAHLEGITDLLQRALGEHIEIRFVLTPDLWPAMVDPGQLENALLNLCINARDAMGDGGFLTIETANAVLDEHYADTHMEVNPGEYVLLSVTDTGEGIAPEILDKVFEPFFTTKGAERGTGLGLSMVHGFVKQSGGQISIYSEPGHGTTVRLYLPRAAHTDMKDAAATTDAGTRRGDEIILLVEDDRLVRRYAQEQLSALGYTVLVATNAHEALGVLHEHLNVDLLFTDVVMPGGMNGRELADAARALHPDIRVLYTSGYTQNAIVHQGRLDTGVLLLAKPYRQADLARKVREALDGPR